MIVLDASAAVEWLVDLEHEAWVEETIVGDADLHAPHLLDIEVLGAIRRRAQRKELSSARAEQGVADFLDMSIARYPHWPLAARIWDLRRNLSVADAAYVALAEALDAPLVTTDRKLGRAPGLRATILMP